MFFELLSCLSLFDSRIARADFAPADVDERLALLRGHPRYDDARRVFDWCDRNGAGILHPRHDEYPERLRMLEAPPLFLSRWGSSCWREKECIAVVGSRDPSRRSLEWMSLHLRELVRREDIAVVSGGARGIDQQAHRISANLERPTVVFLPSGLGKIYPAELGEWRERILGAGGAIVSQYAPEQEIRRNHFEGRNRLIAALGRAVFVVEARRRSGSVMTARLARELGRTVAVLPSFPSDATSAGTLDLMVDGAIPIRDSEDLRALLSLSHVYQNRLWDESMLLGVPP